MTVDEDLTMRAAYLARVAPEQWKQFVQAYAARTTKCNDQLISSPLDVLHISLGRAQESRDVLKLFQDCLKTADRIEQKRVK